MTILRLATWNVCGLASDARVGHVTEDFLSYNLSVAALQETKLRVDGVTHRTLRGGLRLLLFPQEDGRHGGLGFLISDGIAENVKSYSQLSDRVAYLDVEIPHRGGSTRPPTHLRLINCYAPTLPKSIANPELAERFYDDLTRAMDVPARFETWFLGDFNAIIGVRTLRDIACGLDEIMGDHSVGRRNVNGRRLVNFCMTNHLFVANSAFRHSSRHITTRTGWIKDKKSGLTRPYYAQIDYILCRSRSKCLLDDARAYAGTVHRSDHKLVFATVDLVLHKLERKKKLKHKVYDTATNYNSSKYRCSYRVPDQTGPVNFRFLSDRLHRTRFYSPLQRCQTCS